MRIRGVIATVTHHLRTDRLTAVLLVVLLAGSAVLGLRAVGGGQPIDRLGMLSGRDDHGALASDTVDVLAGPAVEGQERVVATVDDGTLVRLLGDDGGSWVQVATLDGLSTGWVDDFHLRSTAHAVADAPACPVPLYDDVDGAVLDVLRPSEQVALLDHHLGADGSDWVGVATRQTDQIGLLPASVLQELPGPMPQPGTACEDIRPDPEAVPHRH